MNEQKRNLFCVRCGRRVREDDIDAVALQGNAGVMCGEDVDKLIAGIYVDRRGDSQAEDDEDSGKVHRGRGTRHWSFRLPGAEGVA